MIRGSRLLAAVLVVAALVAGGLWLNGARTYDSVEAGSFFDPGAKRFGPGRRTHVGLTLKNSGGRSVKITRVGELGGRLLVETGAKMAVGDYAGRTPREVVAFDDFQLEPDRERYVELEYRMAGCVEWEAGTSVRITDVPVRYRTLVFERTERIRLQTPVEIRRSERARCRR
jgi:hypothetical protein